LPLAKQVAERLMEHDALAAHARDELGLSDTTAARPLQAAAASAASFATGALIPLIVAAAADTRYLIGCTVAASLICLLFLGGVSAKVGGADVVAGALRVTLWSALAMVVTAAVGALIGALV
jgi:vacuolar iron transporter family protein